MNASPQLLELARQLTELRARAGSPTYDAMVARAQQEGLTVAKSTLWSADKGKRLPGWRVTRAYVVGCKGDPADVRPQWQAADRANSNGSTRTTARRQVRTPVASPTVAPPADPSTATTPEELRRLLRMLYQENWGGSLRAAATEAERHGLTLSRSVIQNLLDPRQTSLPRVTTLTAVLTICGVPEADRPAWLAARNAIDERQRPESAPAPQRRPARPPRQVRRQPAGPDRRIPAKPPPQPPARSPATTADHTRPDRARQRTTGLVILAACLMIMGLVPSAAYAAHQSSRQKITVIPPLPRLQYPENAPPARPQLLALAGRAEAASDAAAIGRYTYVRTQTWNLDTTATAPPQATATEERLWWAADRSARQASIILDCPPGPATAIRDKHATRPARTVYDHPAGEYSLVIDTPSADPSRLAEQLDEHNPASNGPHATIEAVADMYKQQGLTADQRAAVLRVLADINSLRDRGSTADKAGRPGIAISADSPDGAIRDLAIFDADTGDLLSYERIVLISPPRSPVRAPIVTSYVLYLAHGVTDDIE